MQLVIDTFVILKLSDRAIQLREVYNMRISMRQIKKAMKELFIVWAERGDERYFEFFNSFRTMKHLDLITYEEWTKIYEYDRELFTAYCDGKLTYEVWKEVNT